MDDEELLPKSHNSKSLSVWKAIIIGWLIVNLPALLIMLSIFIIGMNLGPKIWWLFLIIGIAVGWTWWSFTIPRWRRWAHRRGAAPDKLQKAAVATGLVWPKGWIFEKTEAKIDK